jgi:chromosomal replication initiator protein
MKGTSMSLWDKALDTISRDVKKSVFDSWIRPLKAVSQEHDKIVLEAGNTFQKDFVETNYSSLIKDSLKLLANRDISVLFTIARKDPAAVALPPRKRPVEVLPAPAEPSGNGRGFLDRYTFESFVTGESNRVAFSAALASAREPGKAYNPLFLYGKKGLGKTHLLHAIGNFIAAERLPFAVKYSTIEEFRNDFSDAIKRRDFDAFLGKYRNNDVLLIDDINLLEKMEGSQDMFLHTFNALYLAGKQIVLTADRPPREIANVQPRLINRFEQGLIAEIRSPDLRTRQDILRKIAEQEKFEIDSRLIGYIASRVINDVRELEGSMKRLVCECRFNQSPVSQDLVDRVLGLYFNVSRGSPLTVRRIAEKTAEHYRISAESLRHRRKDGTALLPRQVAMYLAVELSGQQIKEIGREFGRSHSSVIHSHHRIAEAMEKDIVVKNAVDTIRADLNADF